MPRLITPTPAPSTIRCRLHRARRRAIAEFTKLAYSSTDVSAMFTALELLESQLIVDTAYPA
jgi:hypothetical protein